MSNAIINTIKFFIKERKSPISMFEDREYSALEVYFMLRRLPGIGPKKANMITRDFIYRSLNISKRHPWFDQIKGMRPNFNVKDERLLDLPIDVHVVKVFNRIFGRKFGKWSRELPNHILDIVSFSKLVFPELPAKLDEILWQVGREYCSDYNPKCLVCPLKEICETAVTN
jgi:endonuclease III